MNRWFPNLVDSGCSTPTCADRQIYIVYTKVSTHKPPLNQYTLLTKVLTINIPRGIYMSVSERTCLWLFFFWNHPQTKKIQCGCENIGPQTYCVNRFSNVDWMQRGIYIFLYTQYAG